MPDSGRGRLVNEQMFGTWTMYRNVRARGSTAVSRAVSDYFFSPLYPATINQNWPLTVTQVAFATDPFNSGVSPIWQDLSTRIRAMDSSAGRQYELDQVSAGEAALTIYDPDEAVNPTNPLSPYYPNVKVYRRIIDQAMWPPQPIGGAVNLLNSISGYDSTFESYAVASTPSWVSGSSLGGGVPVVDNNFPHTGSQCLLLTSFLATPGSQYINVSAATIPGQVYTASVWVRHNIGTASLLLDNGVQLATTTQTNNYVRLSGTFTATQPATKLLIGSNNAQNAGSLRIDDIQLEPGNTMSAFSTSGPTVNSVFGGFVERWPSSWNFHGTYGMAQITAVDAFAPMAVQFLGTEYRNSVLTKGPLYYYTLGEAQGAAFFADSSTNLGSPLGIWSSPAGVPTPIAAGTSISPTIAGDPGGTGVKFTADLVNSVDQQGQVLITSSRGGSTSLPIGIPATPITAWALTFAIWINTTTLASSYPSNAATIAILKNSLVGAAADSPISIGYNIAGGGSILARIQNISNNPSGPITLDAQAAASIADGHWHLILATASQDVTNSNIALYIDGTQVATNTIATATFPFIGTSAKTLEIGGGFSLTAGYFSTFNGTCAHTAIWNRVLSSSEITDLSTAAGGYVNERSDQRIARYLSYHYVAPSALEVGASVMGVSNLANNTALLDACQAVTTSENGLLIVSPPGSGTITFEARTHRYLETAATWVFGENEIPYLETLQYDYDPTQVFNDIVVTRANGIVAAGGSQAAIAASQLAYGKRSLTRTINVASDLETQDAANWLFAGHQQPNQRIAQITINPAANPSIWSSALGIRIGDRATVKRRTSSGYVMNADYFIERIEHSRNDAGQWQITYQMSPANPPAQAGILENTTFGRLGSGGADLVTALTNTATTAVVFSTSGNDLFTTTGTPFNAVIDLEPVTVTSVASVASDAFARTVSNGWGTADTGQTWAVDGGVASDYSVVP